MSLWDSLEDAHQTEMSQLLSAWDQARSKSPTKCPSPDRQALLVEELEQAKIKIHDLQCSSEDHLSHTRQQLEDLKCEVACFNTAMRLCTIRATESQAQIESLTAQNINLQNELAQMQNGLQECRELYSKLWEEHSECRNREIFHEGPGCGCQTLATSTSKMTITELGALNVQAKSSMPASSLILGLDAHKAIKESGPLGIEANSPAFLLN
ncbi:hypothetical protein K439DRAFT_1615427 [Ramaria rubella]|nr:hypothetical protein K439DRAFT_1615427 [Ramaria rubella]